MVGSPGTKAADGFWEAEGGQAPDLALKYHMPLSSLSSWSHPAAFQERAVVTCTGA